MTLTQSILDFLRDGQYRIAQLSSELDDLKDDGGYLYDDRFLKRLQISVLMDILYEGKWYILDGFNHVQIGDALYDWTEREVMQAIESVRYETDMNEIPFITFTAHYPQIAIYGQSGLGSADLPTGQPGDTIFYNESGSAYTDSIDQFGGMNDTDTIETYFTGR